MGRKTIVMKIGIVCAIISFFIGCAVFQKPVNPADFESDQYSIEIDRLEAIILQNPKSSKKWQAHYQLAKLYASNYSDPP